MNQANLKFKNPLLERLYQKETSTIIIEKFYHFFKIQMIFMTIIGISCIFIDHYSFRTIISFVSFIVFALLFFFLKRYFQNIFKYMLIFCFAFLGILYIELVKIFQNDNPFNVTSLILTFNMQIYTTMIVLSKMNWLVNGGLCLLNLIYFLVRLIIFEASDSKALNYSILIIFFFSFTYLSYNEEKLNRQQYKSIKDYNENLKNFKKLLQNIYPSPIFIINYQNKLVEFFNKSAINLLQNNQNPEKQNQKCMNDSSEFFIYKSILIEDIENLLDSFNIIDEKNNLDKRNPKISNLLKEFNLELLRKPSATIDCNVELTDFKKIHMINHNNLNKNNDQLNEDNSDEFYELQLGLIRWETNKCLIIIFNNITSTKKMIELQNLDKYKDYMLATVSHDLRTPLNGVTGMISSVLTNISDNENKKNLEIALRSANLLKFLINDILDFSQISYNKIRLNLEKINLNDLVKEIVDLMKFQFSKKNLDFFYEIINETQEFIISDSNRIKQILLNLLGNSLKFTTQGWIKLIVEQKIQIDCDQSSLLVSFAVQDTGIGIKEEDKSKLFHLFGKLNQEDLSINRGGIGLGLAISNNLAKMLNNDKNKNNLENGIKVDSEYGKGSTFYFTIYGGELGDNHQNFSQILKENGKINKKILEEIKKVESLNNIFPEFDFNSLRHLKILIVDDDLINVSVLELYLKSFGIDYLSVMNGLDAVNIVEEKVIKQNNVISAILMDCQMPIMDGFMATEKIIDLLERNQKKQIPIVAATANSSKNEIDLCFKSGMKFYLEKPVKKKDLGLLLEKILNISLNL